jgi:two-component SAPR family response regulator
MKNELNTCFQQKFATGSCGVGIGRAWCSRKACEICSSLVQKKKLKKKYFSSHKLPNNTCFQQKFATGSYGVGIERAWCSRKACEICSSLVQKKKLKKNYFSSHKLPKQQSTSF